MKHNDPFKQLAQDMVDAWKREIENDEDINGGDAVEWIQGYYDDCKKALNKKAGA